MSIKVPKKDGLLGEINKIVTTTKGVTRVTGYWLNYFLRSIINLISVQAIPTYYARISQSGATDPILSLDSMGGAGKVIKNTIIYNDIPVNFSFLYVAPGTYKCIADQPIFDELNNFNVIWSNNHIVDVGGVVAYGEIYITHDPAFPTEFTFYTFDGIVGGVPQDGFLFNCGLQIEREC